MTRANIPGWASLLIAVVLTGYSFAWQGGVGFNVADEGFLWYGVERTVAGEVPLRDFQSYDPGRYYWCAAGTLLFGKSLIALRGSEAFAQVLGLWLGLLAATRLTRNWIVLCLIGLMLAVWMFPSHKMFDHVLLLAGIWIVTRMLEMPSPKRVLTAGAFVGLCVCFGRNHALYQGAAQGVLLLCLWLRLPAELPLSRFLTWPLGIFLGALPLVAMTVFVPGFFGSYLESLVAIFRNGTNLVLPIPWPWRFSPSANSIADMRQIVLGLLMIAFPLTYLAGLAAWIMSPARALRERALLAACSVIGLFYLHHLYSRADLSHLAQASHPFTLGLLALGSLLLPGIAYQTIIASLLLATGLFEVLDQTPAYQRLVSPVPWPRCEAIGGIFLPPDWAQSLDALRRFGAKNITSQEGVFVAPTAPGLYSILDCAAPVWGVDVYFPATEKTQREIIAALERKNVAWAIISNIPPDRRNELRFSVIYPEVWKFLMKNFQPLAQPRLPGGLTIFHRFGLNRLAPARELSPPSTH